jgi:hypothetical protein
VVRHSLCVTPPTHLSVPSPHLYKYCYTLLKARCGLTTGSWDSSTCWQAPGCFLRRRGLVDFMSLQPSASVLTANSFTHRSALRYIFNPRRFCLHLKRVGLWATHGRYPPSRVPLALSLQHFAVNIFNQPYYEASEVGSKLKFYPVNLIYLLHFYNTYLS